MLLSLLPTDITYATELLPAEITEETTETDVTTEMTTEVTVEEISTEEAATVSTEEYIIENEMEILGIVEDITDDNEELLGTSNGVSVAEPGEGSSGQISNPASHGLPTQYSGIPSSWLGASGGGYNSSWVKLGSYTFTYTDNTNVKGSPYHGATAVITSGQFNGLSIYLPTCRTGSSDTAPNAGNASGGNNGFNAADMKAPYSCSGDCLMNVYVTRVDTSNKRVYLEFLTDYVSYDPTRSNTSIQSVGGSMWYPYTEFTPYTFRFRKESANPACTDNNPLYSLAGAEYVIRDTNGASADFIVGKNGDDYIFANTASTKLITDANGYLTYTFTYDGTASNITGFYNNVAGNGNTYTITFSDGIKAVSGTYRISETKAPSGYDRDPDCQEDIAGKYHEVTINASNPVAEITCKEPPRLDPLQFSMKKGDTVYGDTACGGGSLAGAIYEVAYYNNYYNKGNLPGSPTARWYFSTDSNNSWDFWSSPLYNGNGFVSSPEYKNSEGIRSIPMGTVTVKEVSAPKGYGLVNDTELQGKYVVDGSDYSDTNCILYQFKWNDAAGFVEPYLDGNSVSSGSMNKIITATYDVVKRGDLEFDKLDYKSGNKMQHIGFIIKSKTTGEQHIIVTDENGKATTKGIAHTDNTNGNDSYLDDLDNVAVKTNQLRPTGIWFYGTADQSKWNPSLVDDNTGALPYDDYTVKEIVSDGNAGTQLIDYGDYTFSITDNGEVNRQTLIDMDLPYFETDSADKTLGNNYTVASKDAEITDTIKYKKLRYDHTYTFKGIMVAREDFTLDNGTSYKAGQPILDDNGNYIRANKSFTTASRGSSNYIANASGSVALSYKFDAETLSGAKGVWKVYLCDGADSDLVVVDDEGEINRKASNVISIHLTDDERYWCESVDLDNTREWITFPKITLHTTALSEDTKTHEGRAYKDAKVIDTVKYTNLLPGRTYKLVGTAMNQKFGQPLILNEKPITVDVSFTTGSNNLNEYGLVDDYQDVIFEFDATLLADTTMVVFEKLYIKSETSDEWNYVASHEDIDDEGQSVHFVDVKTTALDKKSGTHEMAATRNVTVVDKVECKNLILGKQYTVKGMIMVIPDEVGGATSLDELDKSKFDYTLHDYPYTYDKERDIYIDRNGIECHPLVINGEYVNSELTFTATEKNCIVDLEFTFDARSLKGKQINVFEDLYNEGGIKIGTHADILDDDQTITVVPKDTSISVKTKTKIGGAGNVKTGDITMAVAFLFMITMTLAAAIYFYLHKEEKNKLFGKMKKAVNRDKTLMLLMLGFLSVVAGCGIGAVSVRAASDKLTVNRDVTVGDKIYDYQLITEYESDNPEKTYDFEKKYDGAKLVDTDYEVIDTIYPEHTVTTEKTYKNVKTKDENSIKDTITKDGITYTLQDVKWKEVPIKEDVEYTIEYGYQTVEPAYPDTYEYTYQSPATGEEKTVTLPFVRMDKSTPSWVNGFSADVTFKNIDGEEFTLGNHKFDYSDNLVLTAGDYEELVRMLGYNTSLYRLNSMSWNGEAYETADGELWRNAIVSGQQYASRYSAYYADTVETGTAYEATATYKAEITDEEAAPAYKIRATGMYQKSIVINVIFAVALVIFFIVVIIYMFAGKRKKEVKNE